MPFSCAFRALALCACGSRSQAILCRAPAMAQAMATMPEPLVRLQAHLLKHPGGDRVMAQVLAAVPVHGLEAVLVAAEIALESGRPSGEHVLNVLARLKSPSGPPSADVAATALALTEEPAADVDRYELLRADLGVGHVD